MHDISIHVRHDWAVTTKMYILEVSWEIFTAYMQEFIMDSTHLIRLFNDKVHFRLLGIKYAINSKQRA